MDVIKAYFISDLHIDSRIDDEEREKQSRILRFFEMVKRDATHLYIVGDLFDFWFEYKQVIPKKYFIFLHRLKNMTEQGIEIHYLAGNHDFALGHFFNENLGIKTYYNDNQFELSGKRFYLFHGDGVARRDVGYRVLKRILRSSLNQRIFRWIHPDWGIPFARLVSGSSRKYTNQMNHLRDEGDYIAFAEKKFDQGFDYVLMGHRHNPLCHVRDRHKYINLGDWISLFSYAEFNGKDLCLKYFERHPK